MSKKRFFSSPCNDDPATIGTLLVLFVVLAVRMAAVTVFYANSTSGFPDSGMADPLMYLGGAREILSSGTNSFNYFPPVNFFFIAALLYLGNGDLLLPLLGIAAAGWVVVLGIYLLAALLFGRTTGIIAAVIAGLYPNFMYYGMSFYSETLATCCITLSFFMTALHLKRSCVRHLILGGLLWGIASQTRGGLNYYAIVIACGIFVLDFRQNRPGALRNAFCFFASVLLMINVIGITASPIHGTSRINSQSGIFSVIHGANRITTSCSDYGDIRGNIFYAINMCGERWPEGSQLFSRELLEADFSDIARDFIVFIAEKPVVYVKNSLRKLSCFWSPNQFFIHYIKTTLYHRFTLLTETVCIAAALYYAVIIVGGLIGLGLARDRFRFFSVSFLLYYSALIFLAVGNSKVRVPLMPLIIIYCAYCLSCIRDCAFAAKALRNRLLICVLILFLANSIYKYREIALSPSEVKIRHIEYCLKAGFPETAQYLFDRYREYPYYTPKQKVRMQNALERSEQMLAEKGAGR